MLEESDIEMQSPMRRGPRLQHVEHRYTPTHQLKGVAIFSGTGGILIEDWIRDMRYTLEASDMPEHLRFNSVVRNLGGAARKIALNIPENLSCVETIFAELLEQFGTYAGGDPLAAFYARVQHPNETASIYAVELDAILRRAEEAKTCTPNRDFVLTQQLLRGLYNQHLRDRLTAMRLTLVNFRAVVTEIRSYERERTAAASMAIGHVPNQKHNTEMKELRAAVDDLREQLKQLTTTMKPKTNDDVKCYRCHQRGHKSYQCTVPKNGQAPPPWVAARETQYRY